MYYKHINLHLSNFLCNIISTIIIMWDFRKLFFFKKLSIRQIFSEARGVSDMST